MAHLEQGEKVRRVETSGGTAAAEDTGGRAPTTTRGAAERRLRSEDRGPVAPQEGADLSDELLEETEDEARADEQKPEEETRRDQIEELEKKIEATQQKLEEALERGDSREAERLIREIQGYQAELDGLTGDAADQQPAPPAGGGGGAGGSSPVAAMPGGGGGGGGAPAYAPSGFAPGGGAAPGGGVQGAAPSGPSSSGPRVGGDSPPLTPQGDIPVPNGLAEIQRTFGAPGTNQVTTMMPAGPNGKMIPVTSHRLIADKMKGAFEEIKERGLSHLIDSFDGTYNNRAKRGGTEKSTHAWGIAVDINAAQHPMGQTTQTPGQKQLAAIFAKYGFHQLENDRHHFQYATGY